MTIFTYNLSGMNSGTDEFGEQQHGSQYKHLWTNGPKECNEFPYYTFEEHFGKPIPSYTPGPVMKDYLEGKLIHFTDNPFCFNVVVCKIMYNFTVLPAKSNSVFVFCLQSYQGLIIDRSLVY